MTRRAIFLVNHRSRSGRDLAERAARQLRSLGIELLEVPSVTKALSGDAVRRLAKQGATMAIVGGGDGTLNAAIDAVAHLRLPLGVLPLGTANDFARTLGIPQEVHKACEVIAAGRTRRVDLGIVNGKYFLNDASLGVSSAIVGRLTRAAKKRWGILAAAGLALQSAVRARRFGVEIRYGRRTMKTKAYQVTIGNGVSLGGVIGNLDASIDDGKLDLYVVESKRLVDVALMLPHVASGRYDANPYVVTAKGKRFVVKTTRRLRVFADGEPAGTTPATIVVARRAMRVFVPREQFAT
jgi:diacylglycerol kinase (ATP)